MSCRKCSVGRRTVEMLVQDDAWQVDGDVSVSADGSEYEVSLVEVRRWGKAFHPDCLTPSQEEHAKDLLADEARESERRAGTLSGVVIDVGNYRGG